MTGSPITQSLQNPTFVRWLTRAAAVTLAAYAGLQGANLTWALAWEEPQLPALTVPDSQSKQTPATGSITQYALFGTPKDTGNAKPVPTVQAPETTLTLTLMGVMAGSDDSPSGAIVADSNGQTAYYRVGDTLPGNAELIQVEAHRILIRRAGKHEALSFEDAPDDDSQRVTQISQPTPTQTSVDRVRETFERDGLAALDKIGMTPSDNGEGYVYNGQHTILNAIGLRTGDVVLALNGQSLGNLESDIDLLEQWRDQPRIQITIKRGAGTRTLNYVQPKL